MAVYKRNYTAYTGKVTETWTRVLVLARYAFEEGWASKITVGLFIFCLLPCIVSLIGIYLANNPLARASSETIADVQSQSMGGFFSRFLRCSVGLPWCLLPGLLLD